MDALIPLSYWLRILIGLETISINLKSHLNLMPFILTRENMINEEYIKFFKVNDQWANSLECNFCHFMSLKLKK